MLWMLVCHFVAFSMSQRQGKLCSTHELNVPNSVPWHCDFTNPVGHFQTKNLQFLVKTLLTKLSLFSNAPMLITLFMEEGILMCARDEQQCLNASNRIQSRPSSPSLTCTKLEQSRNDSVPTTLTNEGTLMCTRDRHPQEVLFWICSSPLLVSSTSLKFWKWRIAKTPIFDSGVCFHVQKGHETFKCPFPYNLKPLVKLRMNQLCTWNLGIEVI